MLININNLSFSYDTSFENIFENVSFQIDTNWKLGFIGRNGRGKTTFLNLLRGKYKYSGIITADINFDYFPFDVLKQEKDTLSAIKSIIAPFEKWENEMQKFTQKGDNPKALEQYGDILETYIQHDGYTIDELIKVEAGKLNVSLDTLKRPFNTLSGGEKTKLMLASLFLKKNNFLLIDEPTNHLDVEGRKVVSEYLSSKKGFILVSHDRNFLDAVIDHVLSINKNNIEVQKGNYSSWKENKDKQDNYELNENERLKKDIIRLEEAAKRTMEWSDKVERSKIGTHCADRGAVGHKAAKMMKRSKVIEKRQLNEASEKSRLLKNVERNDSLKLTPLKYHSKIIEADNLSICYSDNILFKNLSFTLNTGDRLSLNGKNGSGKSSIIKLLLGEDISYSGKLNIARNIDISYVSQDTSFLKGGLSEFAENEKIDESLFKAILNKLNFSQIQFEKDMSEFSGGQKKKVLIAKSLCQPAHLYIWDEPLNFIDIISRVQIEELVLKYMPTMLFVEHDNVFNSKIATKKIVL